MARFAGTPVDEPAKTPRFGGQPVKVESKKRSVVEEAGRSLGLGTRAALEGLAGIPDIVAAPLTYAVNKLGEKGPTLQSQITGQPERYFPKQSTFTDVANQVSNLLGLPVPETSEERLSSGITRAVSGGGGAIGVGKQLARSGPGVVREVGNLLASRPGSQIAAATGGAIAGEKAREAGAGPALQFVAELGGAAGGGAAVNLPQAIANATRRFQVATPDQRALEVLTREAGPMGLEGQPSRTQGVQRTLGEETLNPGIMALENNARAGYRGLFDPLDTRNNAARVARLETIAGTPAQREAAETARDTATTDLRNQAFAEGQATTTAAQREAQQAQQEAQRAAQQARALGLPEPVMPASATASGKDALRGQLVAAVQGEGGRSAVQRSLKDVVRDLDSAPDSVEGLYRVRKSINDMIEGKTGSTRGYAKAATQELLDARNLVDAEIGKRAPSFGGYIEAYKQGSKPINRMQVGEALIDKGSAAVRDESGIPRLTPGTFAKANDLDRIAQQATGFRKAKATDILSEQDLSEIAAIQDDLQRQFARQKSAAAGSQTYERGEVGKRVASRGLRLLPRTVGDVVQFIDDRATDRVKERLAYLIANPSEARRIAAQLPSKDRAVLNKALLALTVRVGTQNQAIEGNR